MVAYREHLIEQKLIPRSRDDDRTLILKGNWKEWSSLTYQLIDKFEASNLYKTEKIIHDFLAGRDSKNLNERDIMLIENSSP
jgi:hypothetical protein